MASIRKADQKCLEFKLEELEELGQATLTVVDDYTKKVITAGKTWTESEDEDKPQFLEMFQNIHNAIEFLHLKQTEFLERSEQYFHKNNTKNIKEHAISRSCEELLLQETDVKQTLDNAQIDILKLAKVQEERMKENEQKIGKMAAKFFQIEQFESELLCLREEFLNFSENQDRLQDEISSRINEDVEKKLTKLQDEINLRVNENVEIKLTVISNETEVLKDCVTSVLKKNSSVLEKLSVRTDSLEKDLADLSDRINEKLGTVECALVKEDRNGMTIEDIQERLVLVETRELKIPESLLSVMQDMENNSKILCQMLTSRLKPLEQLREILNKKSKNHDKNTTKLQELMKDIAALSPRVLSLEMHCREPPMAVAAVTALQSLGSMWTTK